MDNFDWLPRKKRPRRGRSARQSYDSEMRRHMEYAEQFIALEEAGEGVSNKEFCNRDDVQASSGNFGRYLIIYCAHGGDIDAAIAYIHSMGGVKKAYQRAKDVSPYH